MNISIYRYNALRVAVLLVFILSAQKMAASQTLRENPVAKAVAGATIAVGAGVALWKSIPYLKRAWHTWNAPEQTILPENTSDAVPSAPTELNAEDLVRRDESKRK